MWTIRIICSQLSDNRAQWISRGLGIWLGPAVMGGIGGVDESESRSWGRFLQFPGHWALLGYGFWAVEDRQTGLLIGNAGFFRSRRELTPSIDGVPEAGWLLAASAHGRGLGTETIKTALAWAVQQSWDATVAMIDLGNNASLRVAQKCGYTQFATSTFRDAKVTLHRRQHTTTPPRRRWRSPAL
ncbi:MAG: RimJ/RimL family protein N-acetyltransferase [Myxococcota bacterium]|jgi:RimJ/RimL family protein N-acetyltransferase